MDLSIASAQMELEDKNLDDDDLDDFVDDEEANEKEMKILNEVKMLMMTKKQASVDQSNTSKCVATGEIDSNVSQRVATGETSSPMLRNSKRRQNKKEASEI